MILIADSGSTKTEWCLTSNGSIIGKCITKGINPFYQTSTDILQNLKEEYTLNNTKPQEIHFYGAGCANEEKNNIVKKALAEFFDIDNITVDSDLTGAARSLCQTQTGVACILGTGSNSCRYDGKTVTHNVSPLGFIIGDEGSGAVLGKKLVSDILKNQLSQETKQLFFETYKTDQANILDNIYKKPFPNRYMAQYSKFLSKNIHIKELEALVIKAFGEFIERNLLQYPNIKALDINFTGSVAFHFKAQLETALKNHHLKLGTISQAPMQGLVEYHNSGN
ncbi:ATPase [Carboxylicivirga sp. A043]|uniref:BadF/BadG/BcrA/BcrD ATPase family protein n=1 Tax=Carboxylicivirga litoralis TaxID=2816963 RepID=UPI0021CB26B4|nr:BadF/BadG/BcrA/BcrD ATPase family protein [Carboxylicivirga sp. A043]MCU4156173.1 ATPase [Carboxylicivirga sp. A043]